MLTLVYNRDRIESTSFLIYINDLPLLLNNNTNIKPTFMLITHK